MATAPVDYKTGWTVEQVWAFLDEREISCTYWVSNHNTLDIQPVAYSE